MKYNKKVANLHEEDGLENLSFVWKPTQFNQRFYTKYEKVNSMRDPSKCIVIFLS